jgi:hypothetical protein
MTHAPHLGQRPLTILVASGLLMLEGLFGLGFAAFEAGQAHAAMGVGVAILMAGFGLVLLLVARGVFLGRRWSRGPAVVAQLILLPIAWSFRGGDTTWVAVVLAVSAITILVGLLHPRSTAVFVGSTTDRTRP